jgi:hypothetical protein
MTVATLVEMMSAEGPATTVITAANIAMKPKTIIHPSIYNSPFRDG